MPRVRREPEDVGEIEDTRVKPRVEPVRRKEPSEEETWEKREEQLRRKQMIETPVKGRTPQEKTAEKLEAERKRYEADIKTEEARLRAIEQEYENVRLEAERILAEREKYVPSSVVKYELAFREYQQKTESFIESRQEELESARQAASVSWGLEYLSAWRLGGREAQLEYAQQKKEALAKYRVDVKRAEQDYKAALQIWGREKQQLRLFGPKELIQKEEKVQPFPELWTRYRYGRTDIPPEGSVTDLLGKGLLKWEEILSLPAEPHRERAEAMWEKAQEYGEQREYLKGLATYLGAMAEYGIESTIRGGTFLISPIAWSRSIESLVGLGYSEETRRRFTGYIAEDPFRFSTQVAGSFLGARFFGTGVKTRLLPKESKITRLESVKEVKGEADTLLLPKVKTKKIPTEVYDLMKEELTPEELDTYIGIGQEPGVKAPITRQYGDVVDDLLSGKVTKTETIKGTVESFTGKKMVGVEGALDERLSSFGQIEKGAFTEEYALKRLGIVKGKTVDLKPAEELGWSAYKELGVESPWELTEVPEITRGGASIDVIGGVKKATQEIDEFLPVTPGEGAKTPFYKTWSKWYPSKAEQLKATDFVKRFTEKGLPALPSPELEATTKAIVPIAKVSKAIPGAGFADYFGYVSVVDILAREPERIEVSKGTKTLEKTVKEQFTAPIKISVPKITQGELPRLFKPPKIDIKPKPIKIEIPKLEQPIIELPKKKQPVIAISKLEQPQIQIPKLFIPQKQEPIQEPPPWIPPISPPRPPPQPPKGLFEEPKRGKRKKGKLFTDEWLRFHPVADPYEMLGISKKKRRKKR